MKMRFIAIIISLLSFVGVCAQTNLNSQADNIVGLYQSTQDGYLFRAKIEKMSDGTFRGRVVWMEHDRDASGKKLLDEKNPDRNLRSTPADRIVLFSGLVYNAKDHRWDGCKIYDPLRGIRAKMVAWFDTSGNLLIKGSLFGISETVTWKKVEQKRN